MLVTYIYMDLLSVAETQRSLIAWVNILRWSLLNKLGQQSYRLLYTIADCVHRFSNF